MMVEFTKKTWWILSVLPLLPTATSCGTKCNTIPLKLSPSFSRSRRHVDVTGVGFRHWSLATDAYPRRADKDEEHRPDTRPLTRHPHPPGSSTQRASGDRCWCGRARLPVLNLHSFLHFIYRIRRLISFVVLRIWSKQFSFYNFMVIIIHLTCKSQAIRNLS